ncbi:TetR/AcrR family transcriptional regulator C-terminal domain-containing protein [Chondromyces apiculatus]|uniref:Transcriptional regulator n=1 Tax=Chondromyces apiculatus DSM 436 TaxID=1192034 RepID=A0A017SXQ8_9BACT|nr:TetR/AcrR family transcriptional regulator C-terminal domain-containing protein [Chondromyces apiculatus]EYF01410.1 transcriptional regulator [Chondromyces apiculatus DSM 436]
MRIQKDQVVQAALSLLDEAGIEGVTMRKLAQKLNIQAPSLYWHFASKTALLDGMADALITPVARAVKSRARWENVVTAVASELRGALLSRRDGARVFAGTYIVTENVLRVSEAMMGALRKAGAGERTAAWGCFSILHYVIGFTMEEQALDPRSNPEPVDLSKRRAHFSTFSPAAYPNVYAVLDDIFEEDLDARFLFGLNALLAGLKASL